MAMIAISQAPRQRERRLVDLTEASSNRLVAWLRQIDQLRFLAKDSAR